MGRSLQRGAIVAAVCALGVLGPAGALANAGKPPITISGSGAGPSPGTTHDAASVNATLSGAVASGSLETRGKVGQVGGDYYVFNGSVTCIKLKGSEAVIGALGHFTFEPRNGPAEVKPGTYAQVLTVEFGEFHSTQQQASLTTTFGALGEHDEGIPSATAPNCGGRHSFANQHLNYSTISQSPSITKPKNGAKSKSTIEFAGTGEPNRALKVFEVGHEAGATEVGVDAKGKWSLTLTGVTPGAHQFASRKSDGTGGQSNVVEVTVH